MSPPWGARYASSAVDGLSRGDDRSVVVPVIRIALVIVLVVLIIVVAVRPCLRAGLLRAAALAGAVLLAGTVFVTRAVLVTGTVLIARATLVAGLALGGVAYRSDGALAAGAVRKRFGRGEDDGTAATGDTGGADDEPAAVGAVDTGAGDVAAAEVTGDGTAGEEPTGPGSAVADPAVMTNEERVRHLLDTNGGRMLQSDIVETADWSKATVSRVLSRMEEREP